MSPTRLAFLLVAVAGHSVGTAHAEPLGTAFTYQGELQDAGAPASGVFDLEFAAYSQLDGGTAVQTLCADDVAVANGRFTVLLDFGELPTSRVWLGLRVRPGVGKACGDTTGYVALLPRQEITPTPFATFASKSGDADTLNGRPASFYNDASNLSAGTISNVRLSPTVARTDIAQMFTGAVTFSNVANVFSGSGAGLLALNASNVTSGTVADSRLSANIARLDEANTFTAGTNTLTGRMQLFGAPGLVCPLDLRSRSDLPTRLLGEFVDLPTSGTTPRSNLLMVADSDGITLSNNTGSLMLGATSAGTWPTKSVVIAPSGRVGIGTDNPREKLAIEGTDEAGQAYDAAISLRNRAPSGGSWSMNSLANPSPGLVEPGSMAMYNNNGLYAMLTQTGKLGLNGVISPQATLDVNGMIFSRSGGIKFPDGSVQTTASNVGNSVGGFRYFVGSGDIAIPSGSGVLEVEMWGAGGGGGTNGTGGGRGGGSGAYVRCTLAVVPGETVRLIVGQPGIPGFAGTASKVIRLSNNQVLAEAGGGGPGGPVTGGTGGSAVGPTNGLAVNGNNSLNTGGAGSPFAGRAQSDWFTGFGGSGDRTSGSYFPASSGSPASIIVQWR